MSAHASDSPKIKIVAGDAPVKTCLKGIGDNGKRTLSIKVSSDGKPPKTATVHLTINANSARSKPVLIDSIVTINRTDFKKEGKQYYATIQPQIQLTPLDCLSADDTIEIVDKDGDGAIYKVIIRETFKMPAAPTAVLLSNEFTVKPYIKNAAGDDGRRSITATVQLTGKWDAANGDKAVTFSIPSYIQSQTLSKPSLASAKILSITKANYSPDGCPVNVLFPMIVQLSPVDSLTSRESLYIGSTIDSDSSLKLVVEPGKVIANNNNPDTVCTFTHDCLNGEVFSVSLTYDTLGGTICVRKNVLNAIPSCYRYSYIFHYADFARWFKNQYKEMKGDCDYCDCGVYLAERIGEDITAQTIKTANAATANAVVNAAVTSSTGAKAPSKKLLVHLDNQSTSIVPINSKDSMSSDTDYVNFTFDQKDFPFKAAFAPASLTLTKSNWNGQTKFDTTIYIVNQSVASSQDNVSGYLQISGETGKATYHKLYLLNNEDTLFNRTDLAFGGSFDFKNGIDNTQFYYGFHMERPKVLGKRWGFSFGIYQTVLFGYSDSTNYDLSNQFYAANTRTGDFRIQGDSVRITRAQVDGYSINQKTSSLGGYFNPTFLIAKPSKRLSIYGLANLEYVRRTVTTTTNFTLSSLDTITVSKDSFTKYTPVGSQVSTKFLDEGYFGLGFSIRYLTKDIDFTIGAAGGTSNYSTINWKFYYAVNLNIRFPKQNIEIGSNYKGLLVNKLSTSPYYFSFHLAKLFSIEKLLDFITK
ncbi:hypothetical protein F5148DRAFT_1287116 [Russula earlei]|uniref:Uncharacterized protein n=1 Tax=Russula earlei TaxID=71964 RepID=A0ACC0U2K5_9AGAM|nr:hypothetical protein F5148DRAFT_1287116 [Russula earlei]